MMNRFAHRIGAAAIVAVSLAASAVAAAPAAITNAAGAALYPAEDSLGRWGFINRRGEFAIPPQFDFAWEFSGEYAVVASGRKLGFINRSGMVVVEPQFDEAEDFSDGLARVMTDARLTIAGTTEAPAEMVRYRFRFVRPSGEPGFARTFETMERPSAQTPEPFERLSSSFYPRPFSEGLSACSEGGRIGYMNTNGEMVIQPIFVGGGDFHEGVACVWTEKGCAFIDHQGAVAVRLPPEVTPGLYAFQEGLAVVRVGSRFGYIGRDGRMVIPATYDIAYPFSEGRALVGSRRPALTLMHLLRRGRDTECTYITPSNVPAFAGRFGLTRHGEFSEGLAVARRLNEDQVGYIDRSGQFVIAPQFAMAWPFKGGLARVVKMEKNAGRDQAIVMYINTLGATAYRTR